MRFRRRLRRGFSVRASFVLGIKSVVQKQFEAVHSQAQICELVLRRFLRIAGFHALGGAMEALAQGAVFVSVAQLAQQTANVVRPSPGLFDQRQGGGERGSAGIRVF